MEVMIPEEVARSGKTDDYVQLKHEEHFYVGRSGDLRHEYNLTLKAIENHRLKRTSYPSASQMWNNSLMMQSLSNKLVEIAGNRVETEQKVTKLREEIEELFGEDNQ